MTDSNAPSTEQASPSVLPPDVASQLSDVLSSPSDTTPYQHLKTKVLQRFTPSERVRLQQLLAEGDLGDRRHSQLLRRMRQLLGEHDVSAHSAFFYPPLHPGIPTFGITNAADDMLEGHLLSQHTTPSSARFGSASSHRD
ncbi:hypothetical protein HPB52_014495 [Rhipicephalus sanguineus]|uniref:DUF7041 domain-containing protein n=1 Tax=Rhipicephalus sanguineus TaxID=34632 RepID=A0A9D4SXG2_RHISA|nr:hypothetical protein HPB52_014495 [Rhipicephalus sanguineus]